MTSYKQPVFILIGFLAVTLLYGLVHEILWDWFDEGRYIILAAGYLSIIAASFARR